MNELTPDDGGRGTRRKATFMIIAGWGLVIVFLALMFDVLLDRQRNPNTVNVLGSQDGLVTLKANRNGMYRAEGFINDLPVEFLLDTGATAVAVPLHIAEQANMTLGSRTLALTASGQVYGWNSRVERLVLGSIEIRDVDAVILDSGQGEILLGMSALRNIEFKHSSGTLELRPSS